ncbi:MAG: DUF4832 domain-containing protein [Mycobacterium sp.]|nr:DUF4832 domain-containing protein [Mycobacterium sp.]
MSGRRPTSLWGFAFRAVVMTAAFLVIGLIATPARPVVNVPVDGRLSSLTQFSAPEIINPSRGQYEGLGVPLYPWSDTDEPAWPGTYDVGNRFPWSGIQPDPDHYDFSYIDRQIAEAHAQGERFHFRIMAMCSQGCDERKLHSAVPGWLRSRKGATKKFIKDGETYVVPNWNSDAYLSAAEKLIAALGARYNKDERIEWFEFSGYGDWSENHIGFVAKELGAPGPPPEKSITQLGYYDQYGDQTITKKSITRLVKATLTAFPDTQIVVAAGNPEITRQLLAASPARPIGIRGDCLGAIPPPQYWATDPNSWYVQNDKELVSQVLTRWKFAPVVTEWCSFEPDGTTEYFAKGLKDTVNYHVSMVSSNVAEPPPPNSYDIWARTNKYAGYRFAVTSARVPDKLPVGTDLPITIGWTNFGTAPAYENWEIFYEIFDQAGESVLGVKSGLSLGTIAAEQHYSDTTRDPASATSDDTLLLPTSGLVAGDYTVVAKVVWSQHKPDGFNRVDYPTMELAQTGRDSLGGYPIAEFRLGD